MTQRSSEPVSAEDSSKDMFFARVGAVAEEMIAAHGKDFAMGTLILAARFIAEGKRLVGDRRPEA